MVLTSIVLAGALLQVLPAGGAEFIVHRDGFEAGDVELPFGTTDRQFTVQFAPVDPLADLVFSVDTTGSMGGEITNLLNSLSTVVTTVRAAVPDTAFAVGDWRDFPGSPFGNTGDSPWILRQAVTTNTTAVQNGLVALVAAGGGDLPESGYESLYQLATGAGITYPGGTVPAYTGAGLGGVGLRAGSLRIVAHVTDASSHIDTDYVASIPDAHSPAQALAALDALGVRVIPILSDGVAADTQIANTQLRALATATGAEVPPCGFGSTRPAGCAANQCCTLANGAGEAPANDGRCPLRFRIPATGVGASIAIGLGVTAIVKYGTHEVVADASDDGSAGTLDTTCFVDRIQAAAFLRPPRAPEAGCVSEATAVAIGGASYDNGFANFATGSAGGSAGSALQFSVQLSNQCAPATASDQVFVVNLDLTDTRTGELMARRPLRVVVRGVP